METEIIDGYELRLGEFKGPLEKLLELIEEKELEITRLNIAEVTADFLSYLDKLEREIEHRELADFVVVAARLILIKSHSLLPHLELSNEEEKEIADLEDRLRFYKEFKIVEENLQNLWGQYVSYGRPFLNSLSPGFYLSQKITPKDLQNSLKELAQGLEEIQRLDEEEIEMVSMEEKIKEMVVRVQGIVKTSFASLSKDKERSEIVVMFLALLHLLKDSKIIIEQEEVFAEINISSIDG
jgi:segregation and condensation protein A